jgi:hypothetical protein
MARPRKKTTRRRRQQASGWIWMLYGLAIGLTVALGVYLHDRRSLNAPLSPRAGIKTPSASGGEDNAAETGEATEHYDFYDKLRTFEVPTYEEVILPEHEAVDKSTPSAQPGPPGTFVLQAGSFKNFSDADRRKAQLALLGIEAQIQKVSIDDNTFHRVRIGPIFDPASAKDMQRRLSQSDIEALVIRLRD